MEEQKFNLKEYNYIIKFIEENKLNTAKEELIRIVNDKKNEFYPYQLLGIVYSKIGELEKALSHYQISIKINPKNSGALFNLAMMYKNLNKIDNAIENFLKVIEFDPNFIEAYLNVAKIYDKQKKIIEANNFYQKALSLNRNYLPTNKSYSKFLMRVGEIPKGLSYQYKHFGIVKFKSKKIEII